MMKSLREHLLVPIDDLAGQRAQLVYAPNEHLRMLPFAYSCARLMLYCVLVLASWGTLLVVSVWYPQIFTRVARVALPYSAAGDADYMLVFLHGNGVQARWVECVIHHPTPSGDDYRTKVPWVWFEFKKQRYVYDYERGEFRRYLATIREDLGKLQRRSDTGLDEHVVRTKQELFGANRISIDKPSIAELLFVKLVHPFYIFQIFSIVVWFFKDYTKYAIVIMSMSTLSLAYEIYSEVSNNNRLCSLVRSNRHFQVLRGSIVFRVHEAELVPGDIILRSSAVVEEIDTGKRFVFVKGSLEAVSAISTTTPPDLKHKTLAYSTDGYYCIGFGVKELNPNAPIDVNNRDEVESAVEFEGLALFKNELKPETKSMLDELYVADIDVRVITGDNALTAVHVCRELEMKMKSKVAVVDVDELAGGTVFVSVDDVKKSEVVQWTSFNSTNMDEVLAEFDLAITGAALDKLQRDCGDETVRRIIQQTPVFARVRPQQKAWIVEQLISLGLVVGMCGDGTNDCGALKAAHVGLALSSAEASIVAPFTSKAKAILDVPVLIREGRCALTTSFLGFKYMVLYPIIQLGMASVLAQIGTWADIDLQLTDMQYFWDDLTIVLALAMCMLYTGPSGVLSRAKPPTTLFSLEIIASLLGHIKMAWLM
ncbi:P-type ATPase (P-ATPase) Superfamily [Phytophthora cinnamomi]|uniref:P-type ATPase (P-ATPase) Superfamily n=1 Tax=Phytophthora cinnamomi TaxID=4785 RepID=UPI00355AC91D|nr:P-type ATPase (P-ATPase) Superfamily [Phytophthora cinnamomi]